MNKKFIGKLFFILLIISVINSCAQSVDKNVDMHDKILCIEDIYNKEGLDGGNFGDIVVYDINTFERFVLTNDKYYDYSPTYSRKYDIIMFESLRNYQTYTGLSSKRDLLILDLKTFDIKRFDTEARFKKVNYLDSSKTSDGKLLPDTDNYEPKFNKVGDKVLFNKYRSGTRKVVILYDFNTQQFTIIADSLIGYLTYIWSSNDSLVYYTKDFSSLIHKKKPNEIRSFNIYTQETKSVLKRINHYFNIYDELDKKILSKTNFIKENVYGITINDLNTKEETFKITREELGVDEIYSPIFKDENNIIFVGQIDKDNYNQYLYNIDITTRKVTKLSENGGHKNCLSYFK